MKELLIAILLIIAGLGIAFVALPKPKLHKSRIGAKT
jgi:hypothetical protein